ncbi:unnamed protein product, partial [Rotaria sp. Silwood1]
METQHSIGKQYQINEEQTEIEELESIPKSLLSDRSHCE